ncbi:phenylacetic acid degradation bifunctional protein PaaZ [Saxibacter everestensis]|uniref:Phenylacetic acid degradation bifunctional protein PaaZ n=1 Tax=Saxibacter everestensis TaxID=2909229 RepID=A0ABY8QQH1_9MICO|nr:phenylacetic acid degradation bifunctional protein PaaZ [Brevibacteriaceae bacterium ZFBP1038]
MTKILPSYVRGEWWTPENPDGTTAVVDASTGETTHLVSADGLALADVFDYARSVGGPAIARLTFHQRAMKLKAMAQYLNERTARYHELSYATGTTKRDAQVDIDGGISTTFVFSSKGRREMPNDTVYLDGELEGLSRGGTFLGQHIYTSLKGVAVQVNAFNFPVWGMLEKLAPSFLSGLPTVVKPASSTAQLTQAVVADIINSGILPEGSCQLICGSVHNFLDHLGEQDVVAFTGSASTAARLRRHPNVIGGGVRFTAEADSLNYSILGPDATPETPEFELYVKQLVSEMTVKAGQKCTAIRRAIVPREQLQAVADAVAKRVQDRIVVGDPRTDGVTMGPLISSAQRDEVRRSLKSLSAEGRIVLGGLEPFEPVGADFDSGAFVPPTLLTFDDAWTDAPHDVEAFGPVASLLPYRDIDEAIGLAGRGRGSLVGSIVSHDPEVVRALVLGTAPWHGRLLVLDRDDAKESTGHGSPLPHMVHGGPGRAGGGEELGGIRGVLHHMQRTAVQASPQMLTAITNRWTSGSARATEGAHPFSKSLAELKIGDAVVAGPRTVSLEDVEHFADFTGDTFYAHMNEEAAAANPFFPGRVAHGYLIVSFAAGLFVWPDPGPVLANYGLENLRFVTPVSPGDSLTVTLTAKQITPRETDEYGEVRWDADVRNQNDEQVAAYDVLTLVAKEG